MVLANSAVFRTLLLESCSPLYILPSADFLCKSFDLLPKPVRILPLQYAYGSTFLFASPCPRLPPPYSAFHRGSRRNMRGNLRIHQGPPREYHLHYGLCGGLQVSKQGKQSLQLVFFCVHVGIIAGCAAVR